MADFLSCHSAVTDDSLDTAVYHCHVYKKTCALPGTAGQTQWLIITGS